MIPSSSSTGADGLAAAPGREQRGLVDEVRKVGAGEAGGLAGQGVQLDLAPDRLSARVHLEDLASALAVRAVDDDLAIEAAGAQERGVEDVGTVGGGDQDDVVLHLEAVHLDEQLVQGLLALVVTAAQAGAAMASDGVDLVHEDDAGSVLLGLLEQVAHAAGANADEHLDEVRAGDREERHPGLAGDGAREQRLAGSRRPEQEHALGDAGAEGLELLGVLEELLDLVQLFDRLVRPGHVLERDLGRIDRHLLGPALAEAHDLRPAALHLVDQEDPEHEEQHERQQIGQIAPDTGAGLALDVHRRALLGGDGLYLLGRLLARVTGRELLGLAVEVVRDVQVVRVDREALNLPVLELLDERGIAADRLTLATPAPRDQLLGKKCQQDHNEDREGCALEEPVHGWPLRTWTPADARFHWRLRVSRCRWDARAARRPGVGIPQYDRGGAICVAPHRTGACVPSEVPGTMSAVHLSDQALVALVSRGDRDALAELYDRYSAAAYGLARRIVRDSTHAEDVVQEAFLAVWREARRFDARRARPSTWILSLVHHKAVDLVRRETIRSGPPLDDGRERAAGDDVPRDAWLSLHANRSRPPSPNCPTRNARSSSSPTSRATPRPSSRKARAADRHHQISHPRSAGTPPGGPSARGITTENPWSTQSSGI